MSSRTIMASLQNSDIGRNRPLTKIQINKNVYRVYAHFPDMPKHGKDIRCKYATNSQIYT